MQANVRFVNNLKGVPWKWSALLRALLKIKQKEWESIAFIAVW